MKNNKPKLLIVSPQVFPEPHSGTGMRAHFQAIHLSDEFEVTVLSDSGLYQVNKAKFDVVDTGRVPESGRFFAFLRSAIRRTHYSFEKFRCRDWATPDFKSFDAIVIHYAALLSLLPKDLPVGLPVLLDTHNNDREYFETVAEQSRNPIIRRAMRNQALVSERLIGRYSACISATISVSEEDRRWAAKFTNSSTEHFVVPNNLFQFQPTTWSGGKRILYIGSLNVSMNLQALEWFIDNVWSDLVKERPDISLVVAGRSPSKELIDRLAARKIDVEADPESTTQLFGSAKLSIVPAISGSGGKIKVCESLSHGVPVLTTKQGVVGQPRSIIECCSVSDDPATWKSTISDICDQSERTSDAWTNQVGSALNATYFGNTVRTIGDFLLTKLKSQ